MSRRLKTEPPRLQRRTTMSQIFIVIEQTIGKPTGHDISLVELEQLTDAIIDLVASHGMEMCGTFRLAQFDEDGGEISTGEPAQVVEDCSWQ